jgi:hypothetical protein
LIALIINVHTLGRMYPHTCSRIEIQKAHPPRHIPERMLHAAGH